MSIKNIQGRLTAGQNHRRRTGAEQGRFSFTGILRCFGLFKAKTLGLLILDSVIVDPRISASLNSNWLFASQNLWPITRLELLPIIHLFYYFHFVQSRQDFWGWAASLNSHSCRLKLTVYICIFKPPLLTIWVLFILNKKSGGFLAPL